MKSDFAPIQLGPNTPLPADQIYRVDGFAGGLDLRDAPEDLPPGSATDMNEMLVTRGDRLQRMPGVTQVEVLTNVPTQAFIHPGFKYSSALIFLAPPNVGVKTVGATQWFNAGIPAGVYGRTDFAGILLLSCGVVGMYSRDPSELALRLIPGAPAAFGLTTFAGRVVVGATPVSGNMDLMGIGWSAADSDYTDWDIANGAGAESMIGSMRRADKFQGFAAIGFDTLAIINRHSLWTATRTGDVFEPMNIAPRLEDTGATHADTVLPTEYGGVFLSDDGVRVFDGNSSLVISDPINDELLPVVEGAAYSASFDPQKRLYRLHTPTYTYVYDLLAKRWYRQRRTYLASVWFPLQGVAGPIWSDAIGTWGSQVLAWWQLDPQESNGSMYFVRGNLLGVQDSGAETDFGVEMLPRWFGRREQQDNQQVLFTVLEVYLTVESTLPATVSIWLPANGTGEYVKATTVDIPGLPNAQRVSVPIIWTGTGTGLGLQIESGSPLIRKASVRFQATSLLP